MITSVSQRWRKRRSTYRPPSETITPSRYDVSEIPDDTTPKDFIVAHHYSGSFPAARFRFGLHRRDALVGVAVFSVPPRNEVLTNVFPGDALDSTELGRFVLLDDVPGNGETWFLARCFERLRAKGLLGVLSHADPVPRLGTDGRTVFKGHIGTIYQAFNGRFLGRTKARTLRLLPDGTVFSERAMTKIRKGRKGWQYASALLVKFGVEPLTDPEQGREWLGIWLPRVTTPFRHSGNYRYAWPLNRRVRRHIPEGLPYPKVCA